MPYVDVNGRDLYDRPAYSLSATIAGARHNPHAPHPADFAAVVAAQAVLQEAGR